MNDNTFKILRAEILQELKFLEKSIRTYESKNSFNKKAFNR